MTGKKKEKLVSDAKGDNRRVLGPGGPATGRRTFRRPEDGSARQTLKRQDGQREARVPPKKGRRTSGGVDSGGAAAPSPPADLNTFVPQTKNLFQRIKST